jgi:hypothetical protein
MAKEKQTKKEQRAAALATLKSRRHHQFSSSSALDSYDASAAQDVQDILDDLGSDNEMEYRKRVEANLAKEDFVVDDGEFFLLLLVFDIVLYYDERERGLFSYGT